MVALAGLNPKSQKATGGTRIAALQVIAGLFLELPQKLSAWALDVLQLCHKSLKSSGTGEPSYRAESIRTATAVAKACYKARLEQQELDESTTTILPGAVEDRALQESLKLLSKACADKYPEIRQTAACFCSTMAPMFVPSRNTSSDSSTAPNSSVLDEVIALCIKNLDDESIAVAISWAECLAQCITTAIAYGQLQNSDSSRRSQIDGDGSNEDGVRTRGPSNKVLSIASKCKTLQASVRYLVDHFLKAGGELSASRMGGPFSVGGRSVREGFGMTLAKLLRIHSLLPDVIGFDYSIRELLLDILAMVGADLEKQIGRSSLSTMSTSSSSLTSQSKTSIFGSKNKSIADGGLACLATARVFREGLSEISSESRQLSILNELITLCAGGQDIPPLNSSQTQACLVEISHLITTLGEFAGSSLEDLIPLLMISLKSPYHGVRYETAVVCSAVAASFPDQARRILQSSVCEIQGQHAELVTQATLDAEKPAAPKKKSRFQRKEDQPIDRSLHFQYAIHGHALVIAMLLRDLPRLSGGMPTDLLAMAVSVGEILVTCQNIDILTKINPNGSCTCVRAGFIILCGALTVDQEAIRSHIPLVFSLWQKAGNSAEAGAKNFDADQEVICLDATLSSVVAFLEHCSELLLDVPDALSQTTAILEKILPLFMEGGRYCSTPTNSSIAPRYNSAKASIMEAFAWLPPGSFPMISNEVFNFALQHVQLATEAEIMCSLLPSLVNNEDKILDAKSFCRAQRYGQVGGVRDIDNNCIVLKSELTLFDERESVMHFQGAGNSSFNGRFHDELWGSRILGLFSFDGIDLDPAPTALHEVGTWRRPVTSSYSSKVRLVDAAIQAFSATFGLKDGKEQQQAMVLLEQMVPPLLAQLARTMGVNASLSEVERRGKAKDDNAAVANITAVLLACLKALPLHEATHDIPIGLGPPWMNKAKDLLLTLLPSTSNIVRRAAAEGLALLATLGVTEDAHTLQSSVLHSLDEVMQGNKPDGKPRAIPVEPISAARAGSLLTLGCIQRTAHNIKMTHKARSKGRSSTSESVAAAQRDALPTIQMMTRILPSIACHAAIRDTFVPRTYGLHAFNILLAYSTYQKKEWSAEDQHLLKKAAETVEDNFLSCWTSVSADMDGGAEPEKLGAEAAFLAVIIRMMTMLVPYIDESILTRFSQINSMLREEYSKHPVVLIETMAFGELHTKYSNSARSSRLSLSAPDISEIFTKLPSYSLQSVEACALLTKEEIDMQKLSNESDYATLFNLLATISSLKPSPRESTFRCLAVPREANQYQIMELEKSIIKALSALDNHKMLSREFIGNQTRWQIRATALTLVTKELDSHSKLSLDTITELLSSACGAVIATSESYEIRPVQEAGAQLLLVLVQAFGQLRDPADPSSLFMNQFSSQIFSSLKHSLTLPGGIDNERAYRLFGIGCNLFEELLRKEIITDAAVFKRLARPTILSSTELDLIRLSSELSANSFRERNIKSHVVKLSTMSRLAVLVDTNEILENVSTFMLESIESYKVAFAVHCAAVALDSWQLRKSTAKSGFFYGNILDLDRDMQKVIIKGGAPCLCSSLICFAGILGNANIDDEIQTACKEWHNLVSSLALVEFHEILKLLSDDGTCDDGTMVGELPLGETMMYSIRAIRAILNSVGSSTNAFEKCGIEEIISSIATEVVFPSIGLQKLKAGSGNVEKNRNRISSNESVVMEACKLFEAMAASGLYNAKAESRLLFALLTPLEAFQSGILKVDTIFQTSVLVSLLRSMLFLLRRDIVNPLLVDGMLQFCIEVFSVEISDVLRAISEEILNNCLVHESITSSRRQQIARTMAEQGKWKAWTIIVAKCPIALSQSLPLVNEALSDLQSSSRHVEALTAVRNILQGFESRANPAVGIIMKSVGGSCLGLFKGYATCAIPVKDDIEKHRTPVCTDTMKIIMVSYQHLSTAENQLIPYLSLVFEVFIDILRYNGLPNQASHQKGANPVLGRLVAQAIVHVARTTPEPFKEVVGRLEPHPRALLEFSFRAEMNGYTTADTAPQKKKLNLKFFKK
eukprot:CAMPEP_0178909046 /NCGR_PEP_ID=MMETSP0786-20121207/8271_1 /TAXON_ID=186022 /ORGANISM="Thalassionema frauenfeldii, Strain CCMP 1798" /LENGTH=2043 /DNA_ID=CAMNT_0020581037 /DNA_START=387 /DNA_END=6518 /DNA_ORIENTATION=+